MEKSENNIKNAAKAALLSCLSKVPFLKVIDIQKEYGEKDAIADLSVIIELPGGVMQLCII